MEFLKADMEVVESGAVDAASEDSHLLPDTTFKQPSVGASFHSLHSAAAMATDITIKRQAYDLPTFETQFDRDDTPPPTILQRIKSTAASKCACSGECAKKKILSFFPFIGIMRGYQFKKWIVSDIIAGLCVGVIHIPQSMGFAILASLPPVYGLYASLFPIVLYFLFGTSKHISVGTMAIISILLGNIIEREAATFVPSQPHNDTMLDDMNDFNDTITTLPPENKAQDELDQFKVGVAMAVTFIVGVMQIIMSFIKLGTIATFMSMSFIGGFMAGATVHIITSQVPFCLGVQIPRQSGVFRLPKIYYYIFKSLPQANPSEVVVSIISLVLLILLKEVINEKFKHKLKVPIPAELLVVIVATLTSYLAKLHERFDVRILYHIPTGIPTPKVPNFNNAQTFLVDSFVIAIVSFSVSISLAKFFSQKYDYPIDQDQEMFAHGIMHTASAFLGGFAGAQAPPRTMVHDSTGGKTQLAGLVSALLILLVCLLLAPLFEDLPNSVLGAIIIVALIPLLKRFQDLPHMWRVNKYDFFIWILTFLSVVILDIDIGLAIGLGLSVLTLVIETHMAKGETLGQAEKTELYLPNNQYKGLSDTSRTGVFIFKFQSPLYFANVENMKNQLFRKTINPTNCAKPDTNLENVVVEKEEFQNGTLATEKKHGAGNGSTNGSVNGLSSTPSEKTNNNLVPEKPMNSDSLHSIDKDLRNTGKSHNASEANVSSGSSFPESVVILDCSSISYIDLMGLNLMKQLQKQYTAVRVAFVLANCNQDMLKKLAANDTDVNELAYPSIQDAVMMTAGGRRETTHF